MSLGSGRFTQLYIDNLIKEGVQGQIHAEGSIIGGTCPPALTFLLPGLNLSAKDRNTLIEQSLVNYQGIYCIIFHFLSTLFFLWNSIPLEILQIAKSAPFRMAPASPFPFQLIYYLWPLFCSFFLACFCLLYGYSVIVFVPVCLQKGARLQAVPFVQPLSLII